MLPFATTLHVRDHCLCLHAQRAARALARRFDRVLGRAGLTNTQFSLLMALNRPESAPMREVGALLGTDRTTLTAQLKPLERDGLVTVALHPDDRRRRLLALTDAGRARLAAAMPIWTETHAALEAELDADPARLRHDLVALAAAPPLCDEEDT